MAESVNTYPVQSSSRSIFSAKSKDSAKTPKPFVGRKVNLPQKRFGGYKAK